MPQMQKIGKHATNISSLNDYTIVKLYNTDVVTFNDKEIILNNGGYKTNTTKNRMNQTSNSFNLGFTVYQKKNNWFVDFNNKTHEFSEKILILER